MGHEDVIAALAHRPRAARARRLGAGPQQPGRSFVQRLLAVVQRLAVERPLFAQLRGRVQSLAVERPLLAQLGRLVQPLERPLFAGLLRGVEPLRVERALFGRGLVERLVALLEPAAR